MMRRRQPTRRRAVRNAMAMSDLLDFAEREPQIAPADGRLHAPATEDEFWSIKIVQAKTGLSRASVYKYVEQGLFPRQRRLGPGRVAWRASDVRAWIGTRPERFS